MLKVENLIIDEVKYNFEVDAKSKIIFYGQENAIEELLLALAGIIKNDKAITYQKVNVYDNQKYFNDRIYMDLAKSYFQTLNTKVIANSIKTKYHKTIDRKALSLHSKTLCIRGECEITNKYIFTNTGDNLLNLSVVLSSKNNLILNNPFKYIHKISDIEYFKKEIKQYSKQIIFGTTIIKDIKFVADEIYLVGKTELLKVNLKTDVFYLVDKVESLTPFLEFKDKYLLVNMSKEDMKKCSNLKVKARKISIDEIDKYMGEEL